MMELPERWKPEARDGVYAELDHPADAFVEIWGSGLPELFENALFTLYDHVADIGGFETERTETITVEGPSPADALRSLLTEALYRFATEGFVAAAAQVEVQGQTGHALRVTAVLHGETVDRTRHSLATEVKAITYHRLAVEPAPSGGWRATLVFDV